MKGKYGGPMPVDEFYQALYQDRAFFDRHAITHIRAVYVYFTPCDEYGEPVTIRDQQGNPMDGYVSAGGYRSAADAYDRSAKLEPVPLRRGFSP
jgi:hypothetical protein